MPAVHKGCKGCPFMLICLAHKLTEGSIRIFSCSLCLAAVSIGVVDDDWKKAMFADFNISNNAMLKNILKNILKDIPPCPRIYYEDSSLCAECGAER